MVTDLSPVYILVTTSEKMMMGALFDNVNSWRYVFELFKLENAIAPAAVFIRVAKIFLGIYLTEFVLGLYLGYSDTGPWEHSSPHGPIVL